MVSELPRHNLSVNIGVGLYGCDGHNLNYKTHFHTYKSNTRVAINHKGNLKY